MNFLSKLSTHGDLGKFILRLGIGIVFIAHGTLKFGMWSMEPNEKLSAGMISIFKFLSIAEPLGGIALILGFWTGLTALCMSVLLLLIINMKINMMHASFVGSQGTGWEFDFALFCSTVCILLSGAGKIAIEERIYSLFPKK